MQNKLLNAVEVAQILGVSRSQVYILLRTGAIEGVRFGKSIRVSEEDLGKFIRVSKQNAERPGNSNIG
ncbi:MAG: helix-turn-helix domain-containing protein [Chloroflexi bacterium]|nr:helix-turn-helix domain-containing protein [Chloroflexota bacterium]